ncbi:MAG: TetR/AcrR family transcriptional regulator [Ilumatobacteraceae bacterium]
MSVTELSTRDRIVQSALEEIEKNGIVGLRVADVAANADVSVPLIYKYFRDRDGLLAEVLSGTIATYFMQDIHAMKTFVETTEGPFEPTDLLAFMPTPDQPWRIRNRRLRAMAIAASFDIPKLADALAMNQRLMNEATRELIELVRERTGSKSNVSSQAVTVLFQALAFGLVVNDHQTTEKVSLAAYQELVIELFNLLVFE